MIITHTDGRREAGFSQPFVSILQHDISKTDAARVTKLDKQMLHDESWKSLFWSQNVEGQGHESLNYCWRGSSHSTECWLLLVSTHFYFNTQTVVKRLTWFSL